jgi:hypothetical protein
MRCVASKLAPPAVAALLAPCATGLCVPEKSIAAGGQYRPKTCTSVSSAEGRCFNVGVPAIGGQAGLPQDTCDTDERCAPCWNPFSGAATGACSTVSCDAPKSAPVALKSCCKLQGAFRGKCVPRTAVPPAALPMLGNDDADTCDASTEVCAPTENLDPSFKPAACQASSFAIGTYSGVCLSDCLDFGLQGLALDQGNCLKIQTCVPCSQGGKPTGAPGCPNPK